MNFKKNLKNKSDDFWKSFSLSRKIMIHFTFIDRWPVVWCPGWTQMVNGRLSIHLIASESMAGTRQEQHVPRRSLPEARNFLQKENDQLMEVLFQISKGDFYKIQ